MIQLPISGTIYNMMNMQKLQMKWQQRKDNPNMPKGEAENPQITRLREDAERVRKSNIIATLDGKLKAGGELSPEELDYLKANNPTLYKEAVEVAAERKAYRKSLKNCKTKEDVERLNNNRAQKYMSQAKSINANPNIPLGKKLELMDKIMRRLAGTNVEHVTFTQSPRYASLPREEEITDKKEKKEEKPVEEVEPADRQDIFLEKEPEEAKIPTTPTNEQNASDATGKPSELPKPEAAAKPTQSSKNIPNTSATTSAKPATPAAMPTPTAAPTTPPAWHGSISLRA